MTIQDIPLRKVKFVLNNKTYLRVDWSDETYNNITRDIFDAKQELCFDVNSHEISILPSDTEVKII